MSNLKGTLLYTADAASAGANGAAKTIKVSHDSPRHALAHIYIEADGAVTSTVTAVIQGRLNASSAWVVAKKQDDSTSSSTAQASGALVDSVFPVQLFPEMRVVTSGTHAVTTGNDIRVWLLAEVAATRADS